MAMGVAKVQGSTAQVEVVASVLGWAAAEKAVKD